MRCIFFDESWGDYLKWQKTEKKIVKRINETGNEISYNSDSGLGIPEPLNDKYKGFWSGRIDEPFVLAGEK